MTKQSPPQLLLPLGFDPSFCLKNFYPSPSNEKAYSWITRWPNWPSRCLVVHGPSGCGKTHLGHVWRRRTHGQWIEPSRQPLPPVFLEGMLHKPFFWVVDDAHTLKDEVFFLHLYNITQENKGGVLFLAQSPPFQWALELQDLKSRLCALTTIEINLPDDTLLAQVLTKRFLDYRLDVSKDVIGFLIRHMERSFFCANSLAKILHELSLAHHRPITFPFLNEIKPLLKKWLCL